MAPANRYSTAVAWAKILLPLIGIGLLSTLFLLSRAPDPDVALSLADIDVAEMAREQRLSGPRFAGTLSDGRQVTLIAERAAPSESDPNRIALVEIETRIELADDDRLTLTAGRAELDFARQTVLLDDGVSGATGSGVEMATDRLAVSLDRMRLTSPGAVSLGDGRTRIDAGAMEMTGPGGAEMLSFTGGVRLLYDPRG